MSDKLKLGIIGVGNMGFGHLQNYAKGLWPEIEVTCIADIDEGKFDRALELVPGLKCFNNATELINSGLCQAVIIATPHYFHPPIAIEAMKAGLHVMSEKPAGVYTKQVRELIEFTKTSDKTYAIMFNQRTNCVFR
ncbi:MAG: Gfo/Idh/MocA family oxidoreductase, partial [Clostridia bacterium]|nr:Gfo/Idh/MocA family oxidoreductase [Clostridia bacterium]